MRAVYWRARVTSRASFTIWLYACVASSFLFLTAAYGEEPGTPLAGEAFHADLFGLPIDFPERDRRHVTAVNFGVQWIPKDRKSTRLNSSHLVISYAVFCL